MSTILVVEVNSNQRLLYQMKLEDEGYKVVQASDGWEAIQKVEEEQPDLVVISPQIPLMEGIEAFGRMIDQNTRVPVILYSAYDRFEGNFMTRSADAYIVKSSNLDVLKGEIRRVFWARNSQGWKAQREKAVA